MAKTRSTDLTQGPIVKKLVRFALPLLVGTLVQQLYNTVDLIFVGNFIGKSASAAIGASSLLISCLVGFFGGMGVGSGVVIAQIFGSGDTARLEKAVHNTAALCLAGGLLLIVTGNILAPVFIKLINTPESIREPAVGYLRIYFLAFFSVVTYNLGSGALRALGDSRSPLYAQLSGGLANVLMDYIFVRVFDNGINGVAWATLISQSVAASVVVYRLTKLDERYAFRPSKTAFCMPILKEVVRIGVPSGLQSMLITLSNVFVQYHINSLGEDAIAAFTAYFKVELVVYAPIVALGHAMMTFAGQNSGAGNMDRVRQGTKYCTFVSMGFALVSAFAALPAGGELFRAFSSDAGVIALGREIISVTFPFYFIYSVLQTVGDSMRGIGRSKGPMLIVMMNICILRTALLFLIVPKYRSIRSVAVCYPVTWAMTALCMLVYYFLYHRRAKAEEAKG